MPDIDEKVVLMQRARRQSVFDSDVSLFTYEWLTDDECPFVVLKDVVWMKSPDQPDGDKISSGFNHYICTNRQSVDIQLVKEDAISIARAILEYYREEEEAC
jgi:hypothetical protein